MDFSNSVQKYNRFTVNDPADTINIIQVFLNVNEYNKHVIVTKMKVGHNSGWT